MAEDIARLGYEIDSVQALGAAKNLLKMESAAGRAAASSAKLETTFRSASGQFRRATEHARDHANEIRSLAMQYNTTLAAELKFADAQRDVARAVKLGVISADQQDAVLERLQAQYLTTGKAAATMGRGLQASSMHSTNLLFQFQDIGMMLAAGQNPLMLAMQQGTQVAGVFHQMKASGQSAFSGIKAGLLGMVSPVSLLTIGVIAGGAALAQWGIAALTAGDDAKRMEDQVSDLSDMIANLDTVTKNAELTMGQLVMKFGELADEMQIAFDVTRRMEIRKIEEEFRNISDVAADQIGLWDKAKQSLRGYTGERAKVEALAETFDLTTGHAYNLLENLNAIENAADFEDMAEKAADLLFIIEATQGPVEDLDGPFAALVDRLTELVSLAGDFNAEISAAVDAAGNVIPEGVSPGFRPMMRPMDLGDTEPRRGGGTSRENARKREMEAFIQSLMTERETIEAWRIEQLELLAQYNDAELAAIGGHNEAKIRLEQEYQSRLNEIRQSDRDRTMSVYGDLFGNMAALAKAGGEKTFAVWKAFSIAQATIDSYRAYTAVLADPFFIGRPFLRQVAAASALAAGLAQVSSIASTSIGGGDGGSSAPTGASSATTQQEPERVVRISVQGETWMRDLVEGLATQLYEASEDGARVIVAR